MFLTVQMELVLNILNLMIVARILELKLFVFCRVAKNVEKTSLSNESSSLGGMYKVLLLISL